MNFEALWREAGERDKPEAGAARRLRLECNGAFVDLGAVELLGLGHGAPALIEFRCPRCNLRHSSARFR